MIKSLTVVVIKLTGTVDITVPAGSKNQELKIVVKMMTVLLLFTMIQINLVIVLLKSVWCR